MNLGTNSGLPIRISSGSYILRMDVNEIINLFTIYGAYQQTKRVFVVFLLLKTSFKAVEVLHNATVSALSIHLLPRLSYGQLESTDRETWPYAAMACMHQVEETFNYGDANQGAVHSRVFHVAGFHGSRYLYHSWY